MAAEVLAPDGWLLAALPRPMKARHAPMPPDFTDTPYLKSLWMHVA